MYIPVLSHLNGSHINQTQSVKDVLQKSCSAKSLAAVVQMLKKYLRKNKIKFWLIRTVKYILLTIATNCFCSASK